MFDRRADERGIEDSLVRGFGRAMVFDGFGADPLFGEEFHGRAEEVMKEPPFMSIEFVEEGNHLRVI
jgi:hypothetical protein